MRIPVGITLLLAASVAGAAELCVGTTCSVSLDFASGGTIDAPNGGATITFGPGGAIVLGTGGSITAGTGGSVTPAPAPGVDPDMSSGGTIVLGTGGQVQFGTGGSLATGSAGGMTVGAGGSLDVAGFGAATIQSDGDVFVGDVNPVGDVRFTADGSIVQDDTPVPINFSSAAAGADVTATAGGDLHYGNVTGATVTLTPGDTGGETPRGTCVYVGGQEDCSTAAGPAYLGSTSAYGGPGGGAPGVPTLLLLGALALVRRVRDPNR